MSVKLGLDAKLYLCAAGIGGTPTWTEVTRAKDVTLTVSKGEADVSTRGGGGWKATVGTLKDASIEFELVYDPADEAFELLRDAFLDGTALGLAAMDGVITAVGSQGLWADCAILKFDRKEPLEQALTVSVSAKPTLTANAPLWKEVS
jgi:hypothetical protein